MISKEANSFLVRNLNSLQQALCPKSSVCLPPYTGIPPASSFRLSPLLRCLKDALSLFRYVVVCGSQSGITSFLSDCVFIMFWKDGDFAPE